MTPRIHIIVLLVVLLPLTHVTADKDPIIGSYFYIFDYGYNNTMNIQDTIPWNKINRLYIVFAMVKDGTLMNILTDGTEDQADQRIQTVISLC